MSKIADKICGTAFILFIFIIVTYCLIEALCSNHKYIAVKFWIQCLCGIAWLYMIVLIRALGNTIGFFGVAFAVLLTYVAINIQRIPFFNNSRFYTLCFYLCLLYYFIGAVALSF